MKIIEKLNQYLTITNVSLIVLVLNILSIIFGIIYISIPIYSVLWDIFGIILLISLFLNLLLVYLNGARLNKSIKIGGLINLFCYIYLTIIILALLVMLGANFLISAKYSNSNSISFGVIYFCYFIIFGLGSFLAVVDLKYKNNSNIWTKNNVEPTQHKLKIVRIIKRLLTIFSFLSFLLGFYMALAVIFGPYLDIAVVSTTLGGMLGVFFSVIFLANLLILIKFKEHKLKTRKYRLYVLLGLFTSFFLLFPLMATPYAYNTGDANFSSAFGTDWRSKIDPSVEAQYFLKTPFSTPEYFLGIAPDDCEILEQQKFYDDGVNQLYFDAYLPIGDPSTMPGKGSMLIRIHGGGWVLGDKGLGNILQMNKYFAAQGYIVYDIQYFIHDIGISMPITPDYKTGDFSMEDIINSLGYFTMFISANAAAYGNPDLDSVFVSGGSAGGHLTCALALGISSGQYKDVFGTDLTIKGFIPYYPANGQGKWFGLEGDEVQFNPELLVDEDSPPCLIFQGSHDILNWFRIAEGIKTRYDTQGSGNCAIIWLPSGGHACDFYFNGYYNQVFLYYFERFMYICVNNLI